MSLQLMLKEWVENGERVVITGPVRSGKTWLVARALPGISVLDKRHDLWTGIEAEDFKFSAIERWVARTRSFVIDEAPLMPRWQLKEIITLANQFNRGYVIVGQLDGHNELLGLICQAMSGADDGHGKSVKVLRLARSVLSGEDPTYQLGTFTSTHTRPSDAMAHKRLPLLHLEDLGLMQNELRLAGYDVGLQEIQALWLNYSQKAARRMNLLAPAEAPWLLLPESSFELRHILLAEYRAANAGQATPLAFNGVVSTVQYEVRTSLSQYQAAYNQTHSNLLLHRLGVRLGLTRSIQKQAAYEAARKQLILLVNSSRNHQSALKSHCSSEQISGKQRDQYLALLMDI